MDRSEGRPNSYVLAEVQKVEFFIGRSRIAPLYAYVNIFRGVMIRNGKPVCLHSTSQKRARSLLASTTGEDAANWLDFVTIPNPNPTGTILENPQAIDSFLLHFPSPTSPAESET